MFVKKLVLVFLVPFILLLLFSNYVVSAQKSILDSQNLNSAFDFQGATTCSITDPEVNQHGDIEQQFICDNHHFMTILLTPNNAVALRPHPGCNVDAWGSTWYMQPFLQFADPSGTTIDSLEAVDGKIYVTASGEIAGWNPPPATWLMNLEIEYDKSSKTITGTGSYSIQLPGTLPLDLNLYRIASNYLDDVPLLSGGIGDTGDMKKVIVSGNGPKFPFIWYPPQIPSYFPTQSSSYLSIKIVGQYNNVDTEAMGLEPINPAYKPSLEVALTASQEEVQMTFGGIFDVTESQNPYADNIGITPLIKVGTLVTQFQFDINFIATTSPDEHCESTGLYDPQTSRFYLLNANQAQPFDIIFKKGLAGGGWLSIAGNWDGDSIYTVGLYDPQTSRFYLLNTNQAQPFDITFKKGLAGGGWLPIAGDWNGDGIETVGLYDPQTSRFYLLNANQAQPFDITFKKGLAGGGWLPIAGDWNGDGIDTVGLYDPQTSRFYLLNANQAQPFDITFKKGLAGGGWLPIAGDWNGDGIDTVGLYDPQASRFYLLNANQTQPFDIKFKKGLAGGGWLPIAGDWDNN